MHLAIVATLSTSFPIGGGQPPRAETLVIDLTRWTPPDISTVGGDPFGKLVKYGHRQFTNAANEIGPAAADAPKRLAGNNLACGNCHLQAGAKAPGANSRSIERERAPLSRNRAAALWKDMMEKLLNSHPLLPVC